MPTFPSSSSSTGTARNQDDKKRNPRAALDPLIVAAAAAAPVSSSSRMESVGKALLAPFTRRSDHKTILSDLAPVLMTPRMVNAAATVSSKSRAAIEQVPAPGRVVDFATLGRAPRIALGGRRVTSRDLQIVEATNELLDADVPDPEGIASSVSLMRGFNATIPSAEKSRTRRRQTRNVEAPRMGLKKLGMDARGLLTAEEDAEKESVVSEEDAVLVNGRGKGKEKKRRRGRPSLAAGKLFGKAELERQTKEIVKDKENIGVRRALLNNEIDEITHKIEALDIMRNKLEEDLLRLQEEELELDDELQGVQERIEVEEASTRTPKAAPLPQSHHVQSSRRRKGPAFLPSEHDELPPGVAFMTLSGHISNINALDFSEPYGTLVSASAEDNSPIVHDLLSGEEIGRLRGHTAPIKALQVEDHVCLTGGADGVVRLWDLRRVDEDDGWELENVPEEPEESSEFGEFGERESVASSVRGGKEREREGACVRVLEGHSKAVTALYFEDDCLVTGASDKTIRQWDLTTGQCVMTMDILWAISHPPAASLGGAGGVGALVGDGLPAYMSPGAAFAVPAPPAADGSWDMYDAFVGGVQFWGYGLVSGSGDGGVRMWDMRTGQAHRTLLGHTAPVTCVQFDENQVISGSLDKSIRIWDIRTGGTMENIKYEYPVTALQFDSRKIVAATGENGPKIYNRTTMQHSTLTTNGHFAPVDRLRYIDRYLVSGGRDSMVKIWAL